MTDKLTILTGDCRELLKTLPDESVQCCVTSPPYWGLRDYNMQDQIGLEPTLQDYLAKMVDVFEEVRRVLRSDGTLWLQMGDSYNVATNKGRRYSANNNKQHGYWAGSHDDVRRNVVGLKPKDLIGQPWMLAFALRASGWYLRADIIWHKPNPMPESVTDRTTKAHEYIFLLSKSADYHYDHEAIKEPASSDTHARTRKLRATGEERSAPTRERNGIRPPGVTPKSAPANNGHVRANESWHAATTEVLESRNKRSVWSVCTAPYSDSHFATFPPALIRPCILAGCPIGGVVLDPFAGSGTTGMVALELGRRALLIELNPDYVRMAEERTNVTPGLALAGK